MAFLASGLELEIVMPFTWTPPLAEVNLNPFANFRVPPENAHTSPCVASIWGNHMPQVIWNTNEQLLYLETSWNSQRSRKREIGAREEKCIFTSYAYRWSIFSDSDHFDYQMNVMNPLPQKTVHKQERVDPWNIY